ncbi:acyltransferase domain-containing protein [Mycolicibacterium psychrotolerans]|uniref:acyltransferase domain-containing protein n=1 Tax=Mycolicibacterium psychrotolerans TaxID=216929 RepID=UPI003D678BC9
MTAGITPWTLSAKSASALAGTAAALLRILDVQPETDPTDVAYSSGSDSASFRHRAVIVGAGRSQLLAGLRAIASGTPSPGVITGRANRAGRTTFVFPGQGSPWVGMASELLDTAGAFVDQMRRCDDAFAEFLDWSLIRTLRGEPGSPGLDRDDVAQPILFAVMVSLAAQWRALGIEPDAVIGHSQGEVAAAYVAGALSLRDAARVLCGQCEAITGVVGSGITVSIAEPVDHVCALIGPWDGSIAIAERNSPSSTVVAGSTVAIADLLARCEREHLPVKQIPLPYASHSIHMEELRECLRQQLADVRPIPTPITFISTVTGAAAAASVLDGDYWFANLRQPVLFEDAVRWAYGRGHRTFIECSPQQTLSADIEESLDDCGDDVTVVGTLRRDDGSVRRFLMSLAESHVRGTSPNWRSVLDAFAGHRGG